MTAFCHYLYLDSKIIGTAKQIIVFFEDGIFQKEDTVILLKKYKHASNETIRKMFRQAGITCRFVTMGEMDALENGVIFYPFNAQSNARTVANRKVRHIFITHGESSKISSIKPIIRIYDHVATAGQTGIERFIDNGIFSSHDILSGRLVKMGDTFIGQTGLSRNQQGIPCIFYAPTWEGGIAQENYSSLERPDSACNLLIDLAVRYSAEHIVIRPHPNTGHRLKEYRKRLILNAKKLQDKNLNVIIFNKNFPFSFAEKWTFRRHGIQTTDCVNHYTARFGLCDISAMETQMLNENIPYYLYWDPEKHPKILSNQQTYRAITHSQESDRPLYWEIDTDLTTLTDFKNHVIDAEATSYPANQKINLLLDKIKYSRKIR